MLSTIVRPTTMFVDVDNDDDEDILWSKQSAIWWFCCFYSNQSSFHHSFPCVLFQGCFCFDQKEINVIKGKEITSPLITRDVHLIRSETFSFSFWLSILSIWFFSKQKKKLSRKKKRNDRGQQHWKKHFFCLENKNHQRKYVRIWWG